ncbi:MAG: hypothetical protein H0W64_05350 [Gammaproteobacteria bacterium]|nr:hypothetical protein [Gammaproteobacteria bacterium]
MFPRESLIKNMGWIKIGDFTQLSQGPLKRMVTYRATDVSKVQEISLISHADHDVAILIKSIPPYQPELIEIYKKRQFPTSFINSELYKLSLPNVGFLNRFLEALLEIFPNVKHIMEEIVTTFEPFSKEVSSDSGWVKSGNFDELCKVGDSERNVQYKSCNPQKISEIGLRGYRNNTLALCMTITELHIQPVINTLVAEGFIPSDLKKTYDDSLRLFIPNTEFFVLFLEKLIALDVSLAPIAEELIRNVKKYSQEEPTIPGWSKVDSIKIPFANASVNRSESYVNLLTDPAITKFTLHCSFDDNSSLTIRTTASYFEPLLTLLKEKGFNKFQQGINSVTLPLRNVAALQMLFDLLDQEIDPSVKNVKAFILDSYKHINDFTPQKNKDFEAISSHQASFFNNFMSELKKPSTRQALKDIRVLSQSVLVSMHGKAPEDEKFISDEEMARSAFGTGSTRK